jgi:hypothetical protein
MHGPAISAGRAELDAGLLALDGPKPAALARYREVLQAWRDLGLAWDEAITAIDMATLLGPAEPDVIAAAQIADATFQRLGAKPFLARLRAAMGGLEPVAASPDPATEPRDGTADTSTVGAASERPAG